MNVCSISYMQLRQLHDNCVFDGGAKDCAFVDGVTTKEQCKYWVNKQTLLLKDGADYCQCCGQSLKEK